MKKMKKILGLGRTRKEQQRSPARSRAVASVPAIFTSSLGCGGGSSYKMRRRDQGRLHQAVAKGDLGELQHLLQKHDLNEQDKAGRTPLLLACTRGHTDIVTFLVDNKCQLNICDSDRSTPLMKAVQHQQELCTIYLLEHGADPNLVDVNNNTALHFAASDSSISIAKHLLDHKAHIEAQNKDGSTPLIIAVADNNWEMVEFLLKEGASVHATDKLGRTPLLIAASNKKHDLTNILLSYGSDVSHKDNSGRSARDYVTPNDDAILLQYRAEYFTQKKEAEDSPYDQKVLSVLSSPDRAGDTDIALGAPPTNQEGTDVHQSLSQASGDLGKETCINDHSSGDSLRDSGETDNDTLFSSEEGELDLNPKNPQKRCVPQLKHIFQIIKKYYCEQEINQSLEENISGGLQKTVHPTKKEKYDSDESSVSYKEEEFDKEGKEEEEEEGGDGNEEEKEEEEEEDFSKETRDENMKESQGKIENGDEEYFEKVEKRESFTDNECEQERDLSSTDTGDCNAQGVEIQEAGEMSVSFIARHYECSDENAAINKVNDELSSDSFDKENSYKHDHQFQNTNGSQGTENNNIIAYENQKRFHRTIISSVDTFKMTTLAGAALPSVVNSHANKDTNSDWSYSTEDYNHKSDTECEDHKIIQQHSENSDIVDYQNTRGKQCMNAKELGEAIYEQLVLKNENNKEEDPKVFQPELKEDSSEEVEKGDNKEEDGKNPNVVDEKLISYRSSQHQIFLQDDIVRKGMDEEKEEEKDTESPWISEQTSESPQKPAMGSLPASPATIKTPRHSITEETSDRSSDKIKFEEKGEEELEAKKEANIEKMLTANIEQKIEQKLPVQHNEAEDGMEGVLAEEHQVTNLISSSYREGFLPISQKGMTTSVTEIKKSENMHQISTKRVSQQVIGQLHQLQDDSSISEAFPEEGSKNKRQISIQRVSQQIIEKLRQLQDDSSLSEASLKEERFSLKQEEEKWMYAEMLYKKTQEQLRKKEQHYCKLVEEKQQLEFMLRSMKMELKILKNHLKQLQGTEEQYLQSERHVHDLRNALDAKEHEVNVTSQKLQDLLVALSEANNTIKQLQEHIQRLEIENGSLEATTNQQINKIATLQKDLQDSVSVLNQLEEVITGLQREKINLEEQLNQQVQKQPVLSVTAQGSHNIWEEELKSQSHFSELDREKKELVTQFENERKKVKKLVEFKQTIEIRLDQEMKRNIELQKKYNGIKTLLKTTKKKLKEHENGESSSQTRCHGDRKNKYSEIDPETGQLRKEKSFMCPLHLEGETPKRDDVIDLRQMQQYKKDIEEQAKQEVKKKLEEVNLFLQTQASSQETLEKIRAANNASLINQMESIIRDLESELSKLKSRLQECLLQNEAMQTELKKYKDLYLEELKRRKSLGSKLVWSNEKLAEVKIKLFHERHKSKSLLAYSFLSGSLSASPILEIGQLGNLGNNLALSRPCIPAGGFRNPTESPLASKRRVEAYLAEMQTELEKNIRRELDQAKTELDAEFGRVCPIGSFDGSSKNLNVEQDPVSKAAHEYLDVLNKNYML